MRGGTSKGCMFHREDLPENRAEWDAIFLQAMGCPDPKQIDGMGGTVSSNNKIVIVWKSDEPDVDIEYLVGQVIVGKEQVDYKSNCGNMTAAAAPFAVEEGMVDIAEPITTVRMKNINTNKYINVTVPIDPETHTFAQDGDCHIAGVDGTAHANGTASSRGTTRKGVAFARGNWGTKSSGVALGGELGRKYFASIHGDMYFKSI